MDNVFERANRWVGEVEHSLVNLLTAVAPWLAPLVPMSLTVQHMVEKLHFEKWVAYPTGFAIEVLGLATISTSLDFWKHNRQHIKSFERNGKVIMQDKQRVPFELAVATFVWYFVVVMAIVVALSLPWSPDAQVYVDVVVKGLLTTLSIPAAVVLAIRSQRAEILREIGESRSIVRRSPERSETRSETIKAERSPNGQVNESSSTIEKMNRVRTDKRTDKLNELVQYYQANPGASYSQAGRAVDRGKTWVAGAVPELVSAGRLVVNGHGVQATGNNGS